MTQKMSVKQAVKTGFDTYLVKPISTMALGLFASLLIGQILKMLARIPHMEWLIPFVDVATHPAVIGATIGVAVAWGLKVPTMVMFASAVTGAIGYGVDNTGGGVVGCFCAALVGAVIGRLISGKTPVDIVITPALTIIAGGLVGKFISPGVAAVMSYLGMVINKATELAPVPMGIVISTLMGMVLTGPISSAALSLSLGLSGLAAGAATVGCSTQMVGFAVSSIRDNKLGGVLAQGVGTSKLQFGNVLKRPHIWIPPTLASAILGPISTAVFGMTNNPSGAGMGTSGLVGQFNAFDTMAPVFGVWPTVGMIVLMHIILPAALTLLFSEILRKIGWIRPGDLTLIQN